MPTEMENTTIYPSAADVITAARGPTITLDSSAMTLTSSAFAINNPWESMIDDKIKKYCDSTDKHLDDLEEDIEFLDKMRKDMNGELAFHDDMIDQFQADISLLKDENTRLRAELDNLRGQIYALQERLDIQ